MQVHFRPASRWVAGWALSCLVAGCSARIGDLTLLTTKNLPLTPQPLRQAVRGEDCAESILLLIPIGSLNPSIDGAMDAALNQVPDSNALTDLTLTNELLITLIYNRNCIVARGNVVKY